MKFTSSPTKIVRVINKQDNVVKIVAMNRAQRRRLGIEVKGQLIITIGRVDIFLGNKRRVMLGLVWDNGILCIGLGFASIMIEIVLKGR